jgi:hypothetical protein
MGMEETSNRGSKAVTASEMTPNNLKAQYNVFGIRTKI